jgi:hypothetical protein
MKNGTALISMTNAPNCSRMTHVLFVAVAWIALAGCKAPAERDFEKFQADVKQSIDVGQLREWAIPIIKQRDNGYDIANDKIPSWIKKVDPDEYPTAFVADRNAEGKTVVVIWGGGFGHWGLIVGETNLAIAADLSWQLDVKWVPGVYFFMEK